MSWIFHYQQATPSDLNVINPVPFALFPDNHHISYAYLSHVKPVEGQLNESKSWPLIGRERSS